MKTFQTRLATTALTLDRASPIPVYRQVYERLRDAIARGILQSGARLPSSRSLASQLAVARGTIDAAYGLLSSEGYVLARGAAGTMVAPTLLNAISRRRGQRGPPRASAAPRASLPPPIAPFQMGLPALDLFPEKLWTRLTTRCARRLTIHDSAALDANGYGPLREAICSYLAISRGILCTPEQVVITSGFQGALGVITRTYLKPCDKVWFEDPGYFLARAALEAAGGSLVAIPVDEDGLCVEMAMACAPRARFAYVTPSHQAPLGVSLSLERRLALLSWATKVESWIIEDDYDSEFRFLSRPLPALKSLDESGRVLYVGSFSKVLSPALRLGYLVVPETEIERVRRANFLHFRGCAVLGQAVVTDFIVGGHFARHIKRMRAAYAERRSALAISLGEVFGNQLEVQLQAGGMHLIARFASELDDLEMVERARASDLAPIALSSFYRRGPRRRVNQGLLLSFTNVPKAGASALVARLAMALQLSRLS